jgi:hypothetical protein
MAGLFGSRNLPQSTPTPGPQINRRDIALDGGVRADSTASKNLGVQRAAEAVKKSEGGAATPSESKAPGFTWGGDPNRPAWLGPDNYVMKDGQAPKAPPRQATTAPESLNSFKFTDDPWGIPSTAGQMEADFGAREMINARHKQAYDAIDARQAARPDSNAEAVKNARATAELEGLKVLGLDPYAEFRVKTDEAIRAERGRQGVKQEGMNSYLSAVQAEIEAAQKSEGWREREESKAAGIAPRNLDRTDEPALVRC